MNSKWIFNEEIWNNAEQLFSREILCRFTTLINDGIVFYTKVFDLSSLILNLNVIS